MVSNRLANETSPYLLQHADNPVDWYPWVAEAFQRAFMADRPVLLSVGYSACHWCHVMAHESFEDPETASLMNRLFVNIKVDREERPDIDAIYMQAVQAMTGQGGWPMTVFLTPDGRPYFGGTYFPAEARHGMHSFHDVLEAAAGAYSQRRDDVESAANDIAKSLRPPPPPRAEAVETGQLERARVRVLERVDWVSGGFGRAPKFPHATGLDFLLSQARDTADGRIWEALELTLNRLAGGGICDQLGGGFHRYAVDDQWLIPHFEKMLYDNAQLASVFLHAWQLSGNELWRATSEGALDYLLREMQLPDGGFAASQDADTAEGEGSYFVWTSAEFHDLLGVDADIALRIFDVRPNGNFEGGRSVLTRRLPLEHIAAEFGISPDAVAQRLGRIRSRLLSSCQEKPGPTRDDKVLTSWNALAISALAEAGGALQRADYLDAATRCTEFLLAELCRNGVVMRSWKDGVSQVPGYLEDAANLAAALLTLSEATSTMRYYTVATQLADSIMERFFADEVFYDTANDAEALVVRPHTIEDNPLAAGQSVVARTFLRLYAFSGDERWRERAMLIIAPYAETVARAPLAVPALALALGVALQPPQQVAIAGDITTSGFRELRHVVLRTYNYRRVLACGATDSAVLLQRRHSLDGRAAAYVCDDFVCSLPITEVAELKRHLSVSQAGAV